MTPERLEILKMVSDQKITPEQAERLLKALDEGQSRREREQRDDRWAPPGERSHGRGGLFGLGDVFEDVGNMVSETVHEALTGLGVDDDLRGAEEIPLEMGAFAVPAGARLIVSQRGFASGGDLDLVPGEGETCKVLPDPGTAVRVVRTAEGYAVLPAGGLKVAVPPSVSFLRVAVRGHGVRGGGLPCPVAVKTMGGDLTLAGLAHPFELKTMGGALRLALAPSLKGECLAKSMGGKVDLVLPEGLSARLEASTMGGRLEVDPSLGRQRRGGDRWAGTGKLTIELGDAEAGASLLVKSTGGNMTIRRSS